MKTLEDLAAGFREEAVERIAELEATLLELEGRPGDAELVDRAFRAMHTIKGSGAMFGYDDVAAFTHELETAFEAVRAGRIAVSRELVGLALAAKDLLRALLDGTADPGGVDRARVIAGLRALQGHAAPAPAPAGSAPGDAGAPAPGPGPSARTTWRIRFAPRPELLQDGTNPLGLLAELRSLGACTITADASGLPPLEDLSPECCYLAWDAVLTTDRDENAIRDVFIFVEGRCELRIEAVHASGAAAAAPVIAPERPAAGEAPEAGSRAPVRGPTGSPRAEGTEPASSIRVAADKLDGLVDLVGELVIAQARLCRLATQRADPDLLAISEDIDRLAAALRDGTLGIRMVPIGTTFGRFRRLVRDLSAELGKDIGLVTDGAETELDKTVIERLADPLVHMIRNSCDHGIEAPEVRRAAGKPARGTVAISARHAGGHVVIEVRDDGAGLDAAAIRAKAVERGLLAPDAIPTEAELFGLVFLPGFSTARQVSSVSGRGVGMDVLKQSIEALRGTVALESAPGAGTTLRITLPLTLAIIEGLLVSVGDATYVLPLAAVEECVELTRDDVERARGARLAAVRGELVPYVRLRELFDTAGEAPPIEQIAIVTVEGTRYGLVVDHVVGQHQTVIKSLGPTYRHVKGLSGATILGDGTVALIVDVPAVVAAGLAGAGGSRRRVAEDRAA